MKERPAESRWAVQCGVQMLESRVQALGSEELRTEKEKMGSPEGFFLEEVGLGKDLKHGQSLGKEASMLKEESAGYESLHDCGRGRVGNGALWSQTWSYRS